MNQGLLTLKKRLEPKWAANIALRVSVKIVMVLLGLTIWKLAVIAHATIALIAVAPTVRKWADQTRAKVMTKPIITTIRNSHGGIIEKCQV